MVPQFLFYVKLGWYGTYLPDHPVVHRIAFFIFLIRQYMRTIPGTWTTPPAWTG